MKNAARPNRAKCPKRGEEITVLLGGLAIPGRVLKAAGGRSFTWRKRSPAFFAGTLRRRDEDVVWARGWDTEGALALRAQAALMKDTLQFGVGPIFSYVVTAPAPIYRALDELRAALLAV